jgi:alcohol dehydrogenase class IV
VTAGAWRHTATAQQVRFGWGVAAEVGGIVRDIGVRRVLLVTSAGRLDADAGQRLVRSLGRALASTYAGARPHVPTGAVEEAMRQARRDGVDAVVSFGGGSCADLGKAVCYFTEQEQGTPGTSYLDRPALPHIAIPTTYAGAAVTPFFAMTDAHTRRTVSAGGPTVAPVAALCDPELTLTTPASVSAETGATALAHCVEAAYSTSRSAEAEAVARDGAARVVAALPDVVERPADREARTRMFEGAVLAASCTVHASLGAQHGLAQLLAGRTGLSHGLVHAVLLPHVVRFNLETVPRELERIGRIIGDGDDPVGAIRMLLRRVGLAPGLSDLGVDDDDIAAVARQAESSTTVAANPRPLSEADARAILEAAF